MAERELYAKPAPPAPEPPPEPLCAICGGIGWVPFDATRPCWTMGEAFEGAMPCPAHCPLGEIFRRELGYREGTIACADCGQPAKMTWSGDPVCQGCALERTEEYRRSTRRSAGRSAYEAG